jgi:hypothetical protein
MSAFIQVYASRWEVQYQAGEVFSFKFELSIKAIVSVLVLTNYWEKKLSYEPDYW